MHFYKSKQHHYKEKSIHILDKIIFPIALVSPIMTVPQVLQVWEKHQTSGLSVTTWIGFTFAAVFWTLYGLTHHEKAISIPSFFVTILDLLIVIGILIQSK